MKAWYIKQDMWNKINSAKVKFTKLPPRGLMNYCTAQALPLFIIRKLNKTYKKFRRWPTDSTGNEAGNEMSPI